MGKRHSSQYANFGSLQNFNCIFTSILSILVSKTGVNLFVVLEKIVFLQGIVNISAYVKRF